MAGWTISGAVSRAMTARSASASMRRGGWPVERLASRALGPALVYGRGRGSMARPRRVQRPLRAGVSDMVRALLSGISLVVACAPALAQQGDLAADMLPSLSAPWLAHLAITLIGMMFAVCLALEAFARRSVSLADIPTVPRYLTSPQQYRLGSWMFVIFARRFFLLPVYEHRQAVEGAGGFQKELPHIIPDWLPAAGWRRSPRFLMLPGPAGGLPYCCA